MKFIYVAPFFEPVFATFLVGTCSLSFKSFIPAFGLGKLYTSARIIFMLHIKRLNIRAYLIEIYIYIKCRLDQVGLVVENDRLDLPRTTIVTIYIHIYCKGRSESYSTNRVGEKNYSVSHTLKAQYQHQIPPSVSHFTLILHSLLHYSQKSLILTNALNKFLFRFFLLRIKKWRGKGFYKSPSNEWVMP